MGWATRAKTDEAPQNGVPVLRDWYQTTVMLCSNWLRD
jgi:hypothetical protein